MSLTDMLESAKGAKNLVEISMVINKILGLAGSRFRVVYCISCDDTFESARIEEMQI